MIGEVSGQDLCSRSYRARASATSISAVVACSGTMPRRCKVAVSRAARRNSSGFRSSSCLDRHTPSTQGKMSMRS